MAHHLGAGARTSAVFGYAIGVVLGEVRFERVSGSLAAKVIRGTSEPAQPSIP